MTAADGWRLLTRTLLTQFPLLSPVLLFTPVGETSPYCLLKTHPVDLLVAVGALINPDVLVQLL